MLTLSRADLLDSRTLKKSAPLRVGKEPYRVVAVGDTIISEQGLVAIIGRDPRYHVCGAAHTFGEANKLVRQHRPDLLLIEPFLENRDAIRWIKDLATEFPRIRILVVSRQSERTYATAEKEAQSWQEMHSFSQNTRNAHQQDPLRSSEKAPPLILLQQEISVLGRFPGTSPGTFPGRLVR